MTSRERLALAATQRRRGVSVLCLAMSVVLAPAIAAAQSKVLPVSDTPVGGAPTSNTAAPTGAAADYIIGPQDTIKVNVFEVPSLTEDQLQVDANGQVELPLIGKIAAAGKTAGQLQHDIADRLGERYLQNPEVSVIVENAQSEKIAVEGDVKSPGVFKLLGNTTLMQALAMGGGPDETANLKHVAVLREVNGRAETTVYDFVAINKGLEADPVISGNEVIVVGNSASKTFWSTVEKNLGTLAILAVH